MSKASDTTKSIHLSASAGSGKTRALKERYLALLEALDRTGLNIDQAVAITFTDKAAAEIKERVLHDLPENTLKKIIRGRQDLRISTIHSFCMNLLKRYPLEAGLPPDFGVLDSRDQAYKIETAVDNALEESDREPGIMAPLGEFTADDLAARMRFLLSIRSKLKRLEIDAGGYDGLLRSLRSGMQTEQAESELNALTGSSEWCSAFQSMERILKTQGAYYGECMAKEHLLLAAAADPDSALQAARDLASLYFNKDGSPCKKAAITKSSYTGKDRDTYEAAFFRVQAMLQTFFSLHSRIRSGREAFSLIALYHSAERKYQTAKRREGLLDFDDLEIYAYALLQGVQSPDILYWLDRKILHFLVDEFQDTSDIQWSILNKLTEEIFAGVGADKRMQPTLFVVGDEKQSIYRFREANYRLIEMLRRRIEQNLPPASREILTLGRNFRSTPEVVNIVNGVFSKLWGETYQPSEADRKENKGSVRLIEIEARAEMATGRTEAEVLAWEIKSLVARGTVVYEKRAEPGSGPNDDGGWMPRAAEYRDCAILIQSRTRLKEYEAALQAENIPYRVIGGIGFYEEDEIQALINVLFFLWNRDDTLALAAALKSPLFGLTDKDIFDLLENETSLIDGLKRERAEAWHLLDAWAGLSGLVPLATLLHRIIQDSGAYVRFGKRNRQAIFNMDKLLDTARDFDRRGYTTLQDFVEWVRNIRQTDQREAAADMNLPGFEGTVSVITVHKAKGLEFPIVFLPGMNQQSKSIAAGPLVIIEERTPGIRMAVKDADNPVYNELWEHEHEELVREHQRLLYVAMTRARDHLIMIGSLPGGGKPVKQNTWLSYLHEAAPEPLFNGKRETAAGITLSLYGTAPSAEANKEADQGSRKSEESLDVETLIRNLSPLPRSGSPLWRRATDFIGQDEPIEKLFAQYQSAAVSPLLKGNILHRALELFTKTGTYDLEHIAAQFPETLALPGDVMRRLHSDLRGIMETALTNPDHAWIFERGPRAYSELPFLMKKGNSLVSGVIDRVVIEGDTGYVIDYKSILLDNGAALDAWTDHYRPQVRIYCEAVKEIFLVSKVEAYLLFLDSSKLALCVEL